MSPAGIKPSRVVEVLLADAAKLQDILSSLASEGYRYGSLTPCFRSGGGNPFFPHQNGVYVDWALLRMDPSDGGGVYHVWVIPLHSVCASEPQELHERVQVFTDAEAWQGYKLIDIIPLDGFRTDAPGPGAVGVVCIFCRLAGAGTPVALSSSTMKANREVETNVVPCPVLGCSFKAPRMVRGTDLDSPEEDIRHCLCPDHQIFISPSTFGYKEPLQSILWHDDEDTRALGTLLSVPGGKRTWSRMNRERDEDSLTWNVIRGLEREGLLSAVFQRVMDDKFCSSYRGCGKVIYWSVDLETADIWGPLAKARRALGETSSFSEPDIIVICENAILILEVKFTSAAVTKGTRLPGYYAEQPRWDQVFKLPPQDVLDRCGYELLRYFLLAHELQNISGKNCRVVSLTMQDAEPQLHGAVTQSLLSPDAYAHINWDSVAAAIPAGSIRTKFIKRYLASKSAGYNEGVLVKLLK